MVAFAAGMGRSTWSAGGARSRRPQKRHKLEFDPRLLYEAAMLNDDILVELRQASSKLDPVPTRLLDAWRVGDRSLPPSLRRVLEVDGSYFGLPGEGAPEQLPRLRVTDVAALKLGAITAAASAGLDALLSGACLPLRHPDEDEAGERCFFLYAGVPDADGELPVLCLDTSDSGYVGLSASSFAVWAGRVLGVVDSGAFIGSPPDGHEDAFAAAASKNLGDEYADDMMIDLPENDDLEAALGRATVADLVLRVAETTSTQPLTVWAHHGEALAAGLDALHAEGALDVPRLGTLTLTKSEPKRNPFTNQPIGTSGPPKLNFRRAR